MDPFRVGQYLSRTHFCCSFVTGPFKLAWFFEYFYGFWEIFVYNLGFSEVVLRPCIERLDKALGLKMRVVPHRRADFLGFLPGAYLPRRRSRSCVKELVLLLGFSKFIAVTSDAPKVKRGRSGPLLFWGFLPSFIIVRVIKDDWLRRHLKRLEESLTWFTNTWTRCL